MTDVSGYELHGDIAVITLVNPPVNGLSHALRGAISAGLRRAQDAPQVAGLVLIGSGSGFSAGADVREFGTPLALAEPTLRTLIREVESCTKPVTAAIDGVAMGGGLELALGCHYRIATAKARIALPEVKLGLLPGAGGTQRLPRLVGLEQALIMIVDGDPVSAAELAGGPLFDRVVEGNLLEAALELTRARAARRPLPRVRDRPIVQADARDFLGATRERVSARNPGLPAPPAAVDALLAALGPFEEGLATERALFTRLMQSPESAALRHAFFAERAAAKVADMPPDTKARALRGAAVLGAGARGIEIAIAFATAGLSVTLVAESSNTLERALATLRAAPDIERRFELIRATLDIRDVAPADVIVEAVLDDLAVKRGVFTLIDAHAKAGAIIASTSATLSVEALAGLTRRPGDVLGLHFLTPLQEVRLVEIIRGEETAAEVLASALQLAKRLGKVGVVAGAGGGSIGERLLRAYWRQVELLLLEGCVPREVDAALERWGWAMGPCRAQDLAGNDSGAVLRHARYAGAPGTPRSLIADTLVERGRFGQRVGRGYYRYPANRDEAQPDPEVEEILLAAARAAGIERRAIGDEEIVTRCLYALINEGARVLEEGIAARASDIDVVFLLGYGFPRARGGPMFCANAIGLESIVETLQRWEKTSRADPKFWTPAPLLVRLAAGAGRF